MNLTLKKQFKDDGRRWTKEKEKEEGQESWSIRLQARKKTIEISGSLVRLKNCFGVYKVSTKICFNCSSDEVCKKRYHESVVRYNEQFKSELEALERMQPTAYEQIRFHRLFAITTLWPPLHTRKEIEYTIKTLYKQNPKVEKRVEEIMKRDFWRNSDNPTTYKNSINYSHHSRTTIDNFSAARYHLNHWINIIQMEISAPTFLIRTWCNFPSPGADSSPLFPLKKTISLLRLMQKIWIRNQQFRVFTTTRVLVPNSVGSD